MPFFYTPSPDALASMFVQQAPMTLAQLYANFAPSANNQFMYARVSDLYSEAPAGARGGVVVNETGLAWRPQRPDRVVSFDGNADRVLKPLITPPFIRLSGAVTALRNITFDPTYAYPGMPWFIKREATGVLGVALSGLGISLGVNGWAQVVWDGSQFINMQSSGLL